MTRSSMWPVQVWSNGRYSKYTLFDREIASGPSFVLDGTRYDTPDELFAAL